MRTMARTDTGPSCPVDRGRIHFKNSSGKGRIPGATMRWSLLLAALVAAPDAGAAPPDPPSVACLMAPARRELSFPARGFTWLPGEELSGRCPTVARGRWTRAGTGRGALRIHLEGPSGSGRYWTVTAGLSEGGGVPPARGFCVQTSTVGWRTLRAFRRTPLPWLEDLDGDGAPELILWDSFGLPGGLSQAESGLVAWVYRPKPDGVLQLDGELTRRLARELAEAYRAPVAAAGPALGQLRGRAADALEQLADGRCRLEREAAERAPAAAP